MSSAPDKALRAAECLLQKPDGQRCWDKAQQVPPIELYERIKGFAKLCHKVVNHCHTRLKFTALTAGGKNNLGAVVMEGITSSVKYSPLHQHPERQE